MTPLKGVVLDFDGTLADTFSVALQLANELSGKLGYPAITAAQADEYRSMPVPQALRKAGIPIYRLPQYAQHVRAGMCAHLDGIRPFPGIPQALAGLHALGCDLVVLTTNSEETVQAFLGRHAIRGISRVYGGCPVLGKSRWLRTILREQGWRPGEAAYVGDEPRDIHAGREAGLPGVAVTWGYCARNVLSESAPACVADSPEELLDIFACWGNGGARS